MNRKTRRRFSDEFKKDAVSLVTDQGYFVSEAARWLGMERSMQHVGSLVSQASPASIGGREST